jgi:hypothetical protein
MNPVKDQYPPPSDEDPAAKALRLAEMIRTRLKEQIALNNGAWAVVYWMRSNGDQAGRGG